MRPLTPLENAMLEALRRAEFVLAMGRDISEPEWLDCLAQVRLTSSPP